MILQELVESRDSAQTELSALVGEPGESRELSTDEETRVSELVETIEALDERIGSEKQRVERERKLTEARELIVPESETVEVVNEPMVYGPDSPYSWVADFVRSQVPQLSNAGAVERQAKWSHQVEREFALGTKFGREAGLQIRENARTENGIEARRALDEARGRGMTALENKELRTGIGTGGGATATASGEGAAFVTPVYFLQGYPPYREAGRAFADAANAQTLPDYGMTIYMPKPNTNAKVSKQTEGSGVAEKVPATEYLSASVETLAGEVIVSQQLLDRAGPNFAFDQLVFDQLERDYAPQLDTFTLEQALASPVNNESWTGNSGTFELTVKGKAGGFFGQLEKLKSEIRTGSGTFLNPTHLFLTPTRWGYVSAFADENGRSLITPDYAGPFASVSGGSVDGDEGVEGRTGYSLAGLPVFQDNNIPSKTISTKACDSAIVADMQEVYLYEGAAVPRVIPQTYAQNLQVILQRYSYVAVLVRYPKAVGRLTGTAMAAPTWSN
jgi:Phage capsid family